MPRNPGLYLAACFLWFIPLFAARSELAFLRTAGLPRSQKILSGLSFAFFLLIDLSLVFHTAFPDVLRLTFVILTLLLALMICCLLLLTGRFRIFRELTRQRRAERREMVQEVRTLIDDQKRAKIRARYGE